MEINTAADLAIMLHATTDAQIWAKEFMRLWENRRDEIDEDLMIAWFANAMGTAETFESRRRTTQFADLRRQLAEKDAEIERLKRPWKRRVWRLRMGEPDRVED